MSNYQLTSQECFLIPVENISRFRTPVQRRVESLFASPCQWAGSTVMFTTYHISCQHVKNEIRINNILLTSEESEKNAHQHCWKKKDCVNIDQFQLKYFAAGGRYISFYNDDFQKNWKPENWRTSCILKIMSKITFILLSKTCSLRLLVLAIVKFSSCFVYQVSVICTCYASD